MTAIAGVLAIEEIDAGSGGGMEKAGALALKELNDLKAGSEGAARGWPPRSTPLCSKLYANTVTSPRWKSLRAMLHKGRTWRRRLVVRGRKREARARASDLRAGGESERLGQSRDCERRNHEREGVRWGVGGGNELDLGLRNMVGS